MGQLNEIIGRCKRKVFKERTKRIRPGLDDKILTSWNSLMLKGYIDAYRTFGEKIFLKNALGNADFLMKNGLATKATA